VASIVDVRVFWQPGSISNGLNCHGLVMSWMPTWVFLANAWFVVFESDKYLLFLLLLLICTLCLKQLHKFVFAFSTGLTSKSS